VCGRAAERLRNWRGGVQADLLAHTPIELLELMHLCPDFRVTRVPMADDALVQRELSAALGVAVERLEPLAGGDLSRALRAELSDGRVLFVKTPGPIDHDALRAESDGLRRLATAAGGTGGVVDTVLLSEHALVLAWIDSGRPAADAAARLGALLGRIHRVGGATSTGPFEVPGDPQLVRLGRLAIAVPGGPPAGWTARYAEQTLLPLAELAASEGGLGVSDHAATVRLIHRLVDVAGDPEELALLHGDLWWGNVLHDQFGAPWLIDPATHYGHPSIDLAMLALFGPLPPELIEHYEAAAPGLLRPGWREQLELWQILPLLVHALRFGGGYGRQLSEREAHYR